MKINKIAVFDSGMGGLGIFRLLATTKLCKELIYYADNKNVPYGEKTKDELIQMCQNSVDYLSKFDVDIIIFACNTASSVVKYLKSNIEILPISDYTIKGIASFKNSNNALIAATRAMLNSGLYQEACKNNNIEADFISPIDFVPIVESMQFGDSITLFNKYFPKNSYDYVVFACTHYPFLKNEFANYFKNAKLIDPAEILLQHLLNTYEEQDGFPILNFKASKDVDILKTFYERIKDA